MRIAVFGAGNGQLPLILRARKRGWKVCVISPYGDYPGLQYADDIVYSDVRDIDTIVDALRDRKIDLLLTDQLDVCVYPMAVIAQSLGIQHMPVEVAKRFTDKFHMLQCAKEIGVNVPQHILSYTLAEAKLASDTIGYPVVIKPLDSDASRGVYLVRNIRELELKYDESKSFSSNGTVVIEQYIEKQDEFCVESFSYQGVATNLVIGKRAYFEFDDIFIPQSTVFVDANSAILNNVMLSSILSLHKKVVDSFGLMMGLAHGEYIVEKSTGKIYIVEVAARGGGVGISSDLIPACTGIDVLDVLFNALEGIKPSLDIREGASAYFTFLLPEGKVTTIKGWDEVERIRGVIKAICNLSVGDVLTKPVNKSARKGPILVRGISASDCMQIQKEIRSKLIITMSSLEGQNSIIWE